MTAPALTSPAPRGDRGSAMLVTIVVVGIVLGLAATLLATVAAEGRVGHAARDHLKALLLAEAGLNDAIVELNCGVDSDGDGLGTLARSLGDGRYTVTATATGMTVTVRSTGESGEARRAVEAVLERAASARFTRAVFAGRLAVLSDKAFADSYDSRIGPFADQVMGTWNGMPRAGTSTKVASNGAVRLRNRSAVFGDATPGPSKTVSQSSDSLITGSTAPATAIFVPPVIYAPPVAIAAPLELCGSATAALSPGDYGFNALSLADTSQLTIRGPARVVVDGNAAVRGSARVEVDTSGGPVGLFIRGAFLSESGTRFTSVTRQPADFMICMLGGQAALHQSAGEFYGAFYAAGADVTVQGEAQVFGAVLGRNVRLANSARVHFDVDLPNHKVIVATYVVACWREVSPD